jgi:hypothetical protein
MPVGLEGKQASQSLLRIERMAPAHVGQETLLRDVGSRFICCETA